ncbi:MAG: hypothetical protein KBT03_01370 [Bacteroidales bacterium]|nr:hypothetical protein [Candidatus Scybalousia scybalohippi]
MSDNEIVEKIITNADKIAMSLKNGDVELRLNPNSITVIELQKKVVSK